MCHQTSVPNYPPFRTIFKKFLKMQHFLGHTRLHTIFTGHSCYATKMSDLIMFSVLGLIEYIQH